MTDDRRDPLDTLLDLTLYAPIGAALHGPEAVEQLASKGRQDVANARLIGRAVLDRSRRELDRVASDAQERLGDLVVVAARAAGAPFAGTTGAPPGRTEETPDEPSEGAGHLRIVPDDTGTEVPPEDPDAAAGAPEVESLAIPDYDNLSASQVVPRLDDLAADELRAVQDYERAHRGRMTILSRIAQLQAS